MIRLGEIDFDERILEALTNNKLVVFAGAGVSMGSPSNLSSFEKLAEAIAEGTNLKAIDPLDRFLGELHHKKVPVHTRAAERLSPIGSEPNCLHRDLLRMFGSADRVKLVTTNFDHHFTTAFVDVFKKEPVLYSAPALPRGANFKGIVHVHGSITNPDDMVLTDADFGRGYLTEGWARRFLVDVFRNYTVLFVGYSHKDLVMNYLARALPTDTLAGRFALTENLNDWGLLGITPVVYIKKSGDYPYAGLYDGISRLADRVVRGALDWEPRLAEVARSKPPVDEESIGEIEQAMGKPYLLRLFLKNAKQPEWVVWLGDRGYLAELFRMSELDEKSLLLVSWIAENFAIDHAQVIFKLFVANGQRLNPRLWIAIAQELREDAKKQFDAAILRQWVNILLSCSPNIEDEHLMLGILARCTQARLLSLALQVFLHMIRYRINFKNRSSWIDDVSSVSEALTAECVFEASHWALNEAWSQHVKPNIEELATPLLFGLSSEFLEIKTALQAWHGESEIWDQISYNRSCIEFDEEEQRYADSADVLIDATRDALDFLAETNPDELLIWTGRLLIHDVSILFRLAVYSVCINSKMSADDRLVWAVRHVDFYKPTQDFEVKSLLKKNYPAAKEETRKKILDSLLQQSSLNVDDEHSLFYWLSCLQETKTHCVYVEKELEKIKTLNPTLREVNVGEGRRSVGHVEWMGPPSSPWSTEELLTTPACEQLERLTSFKGTDFFGPNREGLAEAVREAIKTDKTWGFGLCEALKAKQVWQTDLWRSIIRGFSEGSLEISDWLKVLSVFNEKSLFAAFGGDIANFLYLIVKNQGSPFYRELIPVADEVALKLWDSLPSDLPDTKVLDWLQAAINRPAGVLVEYWLSSLSLLLREDTSPKRLMPPRYKSWFNSAIKDESINGAYARCVLAGQLGFLYAVDSEWATELLVPLFTDESPQVVEQVWDGFLIWGRLKSPLAEALTPAFMSALQRLDKDFKINRSRFMEFVAALAVYYVPDPTEVLIPVLLKHGNTDDHASFASFIHLMLTHLTADAKCQLWDGWLKRYWMQRNQAVPIVLKPEEMARMLDWIVQLEDKYPDAIKLCIDWPPVSLGHGSMLYELAKSELPIKHQDITAQLLIYLSRCDLGFLASYLVDIASRLNDLSEGRRQSLNEALTYAGLK